MTTLRGPAFRRTAAVCLLSAALLLSAPFAHAAAQSRSKPKSTPGLEAAKSLSTITGVAISPLLGVGAVGAYQYFKAPSDQRAKLGWYAQPWFWVPALLLVGFVAVKDIFGTAAPTALKKPFDIAETVENKVSGLVAAGAFVPLMVSVFPETSDYSTLGDLGFAALDGTGFLNLLLTPFAIVAFILVFLAAHAINILILLSPFTTVDAALKSFRLALLSLFAGISFANPYLGAAISVVLIVLAWFIAGWSFRLTVFGSVFAWDFLTFRRHRFQPGTMTNRAFTAGKIEGAPRRTFGRIVRGASGEATFEYRPWLILPRRAFHLPQGTYVVGRGIFFPEIARVDGENLPAVFLLPPRFKGHEEAVVRAYGFKEVRDIGILQGFKASWAWLKSLFTGQAPQMQQAAAT